MTGPVSQRAMEVDSEWTEVMSASSASEEGAALDFVSGRGPLRQAGGSAGLGFKGLKLLTQILSVPV